MALIQKSLNNPSQVTSVTIEPVMNGEIIVKSRPSRDVYEDLCEKLLLENNIIYKKCIQLSQNTHDKKYQNVKGISSVKKYSAIAEFDFIIHNAVIELKSGNLTRHDSFLELYEQITRQISLIPGHFKLLLCIGGKISKNIARRLNAIDRLIVFNQLTDLMSHIVTHNATAQTCYATNDPGILRSFVARDSARYQMFSESMLKKTLYTTQDAFNKSVAIISDDQLEKFLEFVKVDDSLFSESCCENVILLSMNIVKKYKLASIFSIFEHNTFQKCVSTYAHFNEGSQKRMIAGYNDHCSACGILYPLQSLDERVQCKKCSHKDAFHVIKKCNLSRE